MKAISILCRCVLPPGVSLALVLGLASAMAMSAPAVWFPDPPTFLRYSWSYEACPTCTAHEARPAWRQMAALAGVPDVRFQRTRNEARGPAYSAAPDVIVLSPSALKLGECELAFVIGHEITHIAQRHFDEDAMTLSVFSGKAKNWTDQGEDAMQLADGDFSLLLRVSHLWQLQEREADWLGALLAAQAVGCSLEEGAIAYLRREGDAGGGLAAAHGPSEERIRQLRPFAESARRLVDLLPR